MAHFARIENNTVQEVLVVPDQEDANHDWQAPKAKPEDGLVYFWNEEKLDWEAFVNDAI